MIKKLQLKFVLWSMVCFFLILAIIITAVNLINLNNIISESDKLLELIAESGGFFPQINNGRPNLPYGMSPEIPYESRYFSATLNSQTGAVLQTDTSRIISVDSARALEYANWAIDSGKDKGFIDSFRFIVQRGQEKSRIVFLDCGRKIDSFYNFMWTSIAISVIGYLVVFTLILIFSNRFVRPIARSYEKQKRFITDAGHEIKTPLSIISANTDVLEMTYGKTEWIEDIQKQTKRLTELTNDLVSLARMEETEKSLPMLDFPFSEVVEEAVSPFIHIAESQGKYISSSIQPFLSICGNEKAIRQLVGILLDNALKYSPEGSEILINAEKSGRFIRLSISNLSVFPIDKQTLPLLFDRFYRADPSRSSDTGGYGIGLSIAKAIVSSHKGKIFASSDDGNSLSVNAVFPT